MAMHKIITSQCTKMHGRAAVMTTMTTVVNHVAYPMTAFVAIIVNGQLLTCGGSMADERSR